MYYSCPSRTVQLHSCTTDVPVKQHNYMHILVIFVKQHNYIQFYVLVAFVKLYNYIHVLSL